MQKTNTGSMLYICNYFFLVCISHFLSINLPAQDNPKGLPFITNYRYQDYNAGGVNWWAEEDDKGVMYFANAAGVLVYDGQQWDLVRPPGADETRSLTKGKDGKIYVSTNGDIGYLEPGKKGKLAFISLKDKLPEKHRIFTEVWEVHEHDGKILYRTNNKIFIWNGQAMKVMESKEGFHVGAVVQGNYYCRIWARGLTVLKNDSFHVVPNGEKFANERIYAMLPYDDKRMLIGTRTQGLFIYDGIDFTPFKTEADPYIVNTSLYGGLVLSNGHFAINMFNNGMVIIDRNGKLIQRIDKSVGLQDNSVDHLFEDSRGNLWMPLFNGIAKFDLRSSLTYFNESFGLPAKTVFVVGNFRDTIYVGTNNGIFILNKTTSRFQIVPGTSGQVTYFIRNGNDFLASGAEKGLLKLSGGKAIPVIPGINYDFHLQLLLRSKIDTTLFYAGLRSGLALIRYTPSTGTYQVESLREDLASSNGRFNETKQGYLWVEGGNSGELKLVKPRKQQNGKLSLAEAEVIVYDHKHGLPRKYVTIIDYGDTQYFTSDTDSVFTFSEKENRFIRDTSAFVKKYTDFTSDGTTYSKMDKHGRLWASFGSGVFVRIPTADGSFKFVDAPFRELGRNYPVWQIEISEDKNGKQVVWFTGREGLIRYDGDLNETAGGSFNTVIRGINLNEDSVFYSGFGLSADKITFSHKWNSVRFSYAAPFFKQENETLFSTYLEGRDKGWSEWGKQTFREFGNLPAGTYTFKVKAKNIYDVESKEAAYTFSVLPPWYATWWAYVLYVLGAIGLIYLIVRWRTKQLHDKHKELEKVVEQRTYELKQRAEENARLFDESNRLLKETEQRTAELAVINSVQEGLAKELDIQGIYNLVGDRLCDLFPDTQTLVIRTFDHETGLEYFKYAIEKGNRLFVEPRPFMWANKSMIESKKPIDIRENYVETAKQHGGTGVTTGQPPKSALFVPMIVGDIVKGSISLQNVDRENAFNDADLRLLTTITNSMSVALENARLFDETNRLLKETEQRTAELAVINSVQEGLVREMNMQAIYDLVGNRICELFDTQTVLIRTFNHREQLENWHFVIEKGQRFYSNPRPIMWANKLMIDTRQPLLINENYIETAQKHGSPGVSKGLPPKSALFVPMIVGDVVRGSVSLQNVEKENAFTESDLRLLTTLTNSMSVALENARLFDESNKLLAEAKQRAAELSTVNSISKALASQLNANDLIKMVGDQLKDLFNANIVYLALLNPKTNIINFPYQYGDNMAPIKLGEGLTSKIILNGEPLLINKDLQELRLQMGIQQIGVPAASYLGVPIPVGDENIGVLSVQSTETENRFNENDLRLLSTIASSVGVALNNATLFEDVKLAKMEAEKSGKAAEKANEAKSAFLSTVSHELRTPLTSVLGFAKIIRKRLEEKIFPIVDKKDPKTDKTISQISENLHVVIAEGERLTHLINDVLDLAKIEAGKMEWNQENVSMPEVAERAIAATTSLFDQKALKLIKNIDTDLPDIIGDRDKLIQVIINLISNSVKFTEKGSVTCSVSKINDEIVVSISDTGIGIAPEDFDAVFEQFKQVGGDTLTDKPKGTGLGLPICKEIVEHHGGRIWLESEVGKGSTFSFALPVTKTNGMARPMHLDDLVKQLKEQVAQSYNHLAGKASKILIVDDDDSIRSLLQQELGDAGYSIEEARNGKEALAAVRKQRPDLIILDIMMPEMNGFDVAAVLKNDPQTMDIPIIVLSIVQDKTRGFRIGVDRYLTKPIDTGLLFSEIGSLLEQGKSKKKVMVVDQDSATVSTLTEVLKTKGYSVMEANENELIEKAIANQPDIIIINSVLSGKQDIVQTIRFEKGLENVLFLVYQ